MPKPSKDSTWLKEFKGHLIEKFNSYQWRKAVAPILFLSATSIAGGITGAKVHDFMEKRGNIQAEFTDAKKHKDKFISRGVRIGAGSGAVLFTGIAAYRRRF